MSDEDGRGGQGRPAHPDPDREDPQSGATRRRLLIGVAALVGLLLLGLAIGLRLRGSGDGGPTLAVSAASIHEDPPQPVEGLSCNECHWTSTPSQNDPGLKADVSESCVNCHPKDEGSDDTASEHPPFARNQCVDCHQAHASDEASLLEADVTDLCFSCHARKGRQVDDPYAHPPFAEGECTSCHDPHRSTLPNLLLAQEPELCVDCHQTALGETRNLEYVHPPFASGQCTACHTPHASTVAGQLRAPTAQVCLSCHESGAGHIDPMHPHVEAGLCVSCHEPHASDEPLLLREVGGALCLSCHRK